MARNVIPQRMLDKAIRYAHNFGRVNVTLTEKQLLWIEEAQRLLLAEYDVPEGSPQRCETHGYGCGLHEATCRDRGSPQPAPEPDYVPPTECGWAEDGSPQQADAPVRAECRHETIVYNPAGSTRCAECGERNPR